MSQEFQATYEHGVLRLDAPLAIPERTRVTGVVNDVDSAGEPPLPDLISVEEFDRLLDELAMPLGGKLPADLSRADIYFDHD
jgi:hypothetical protein